ncbi:MAG: hypothetical protein JJ863_34585 [Deltaproteobacteria bacterium]|nr:hypothetical protein [Deltaproteobacteria bacterium]
MKSSRVVLAALALLALSSVAAGQPPAAVPVQGVLTDSEGAPLEGTVDVTFTLYDAPTDGSMLFSETIAVNLEGGAFSVYLGTGTPLDLSLFRDISDTHIGVQVGADPEMTPRIRLGTVPYAAFARYAGDAATIDGLGSADLALAAHGHGWTDITGRPAGLDDGDDDTTYDGTSFATSDQSCMVGQVVVGIDASGAITCAADTDNDTTYDGSDFATSGQSCGVGQVVTGIDASGAVNCAADLDTDTNTTYDGSDFATSGQSCGANERMVGIAANGAIQCQPVTTIPSGMIAFFAGGCPTGFVDYAPLRGRFLVGTPSGGTDEGNVGTAFGDLGTRSITEVPAHTHSVNPPNTTTNASGAHNHAVDPPSTSTTTAGNHNHAFYTANNDTNGAASQGYPAGNNHIAFRTTDRRQRTHDNGNILANGNHSHAVNIPAFASATGGNHTHNVDIAAFTSGGTGVAAVDVTMPYLQLHACIAL